MLGALHNNFVGILRPGGQRREHPQRARCRWRSVATARRAVRPAVGAPTHPPVDAHLDQCLGAAQHQFVNINRCVGVVSPCAATVLLFDVGHGVSLTRHAADVLFELAAGASTSCPVGTVWVPGVQGVRGRDEWLRPEWRAPSRRSMTSGSWKESCSVSPFPPITTSTQWSAGSSSTVTGHPSSTWMYWSVCSTSSFASVHRPSPSRSGWRFSDRARIDVAQVLPHAVDLGREGIHRCRRRCPPTLGGGGPLLRLRRTVSMLDEPDYQERGVYPGRGRVGPCPVDEADRSVVDEQV